MIGAIVNLLYANIVPVDIVEKLQHTDSKLLLVLDKLLDRIGSIDTKVPIVVLSIQDSMPNFRKFVVKVLSKRYKNFIHYKDFLKRGQNVQVQESASPDDPAVIIYTSGSTGSPKGVVLSNRNINSMAEQIAVSGKNYKTKETFLDIIPVFVAFGFGMQHVCHYTGMTEIIVLLPNPEAVKKRIKKSRPNRFVLGPAIIEIIEKYHYDDLSFIIDLTGGGASLSVEKERTINAILEEKHAQSKYLAGYGMTELSSAVSMNQNHIYKEQSIGIPLPLTNFKVIDVNTHTEKGYGEEGELLVSSPSIMLGYYHDPNATSEIIETINHEQWLHTGDLAQIDIDGFAYITGRIKRIFTTVDTDGNVYKLFPQRLEDSICTLSAVEKCGVIIKQDIKKVSIPIIFITIKEGHIAEDVKDAIIDMIHRNFASYYYPERIIVLPEMPVTNSQKIDYCLLEKFAETN